MSILRVSRTSATLLLITVILSFITIGGTMLAGALFVGPPYNIIPGNSLPFFGMNGNDIWGFNSGWFLLIIGTFLTLFIRRLDKSKKEEFQELWKQKVKEMED